MPGLVLNRHEVDYVDLKKVGTVSIQMNAAGDVEILVEGFEFDQARTCRETVTKALAWARDVLNTEVQANRLIPGGHLKSIVGTSEEASDSH